MCQRNVLAIIPAYNEEQNVRMVIEEIRKCAKDIDIVVVDDCSMDDTSSVAKSSGADVIELCSNIGYGGSVQTGFRYAISRGYDFAIQIDADGQHDPRCIEKLLRPVRDGEVDVAIGSRFLGAVRYKVPLIRKLGMVLFSRIVSFVVKQRISDPTSGYQALNRKVLRFFAYDNYPSDYPDADTIMLMSFAGFRIKEVPVTMRDRCHGDSMHSALKSFYYLYKMFLSMFVLLLRRRRLSRGA